MDELTYNLRELRGRDDRFKGSYRPFAEGKGQNISALWKATAAVAIPLDPIEGTETLERELQAERFFRSNTPRPDRGY